MGRRFRNYSIDTLSSKEIGVISLFLNVGEFKIITEVAVKCNDISRNTKEKSFKGHIVDVKPRKPGE